MPRVLVIDDQPEIRELLERMLRGSGYEVTVAENGDEGTKLFRADPYDLIITDIIMPEKEGLETIMELRRDYPDVKIIAISGGGTGGRDTYLNLACRLGAQRAVPKPFKRDELLAAVKELIGGK
ncbi:MAG: response regulator [Pseudomonadota bacterium]